MAPFRDSGRRPEFRPRPPGNRPPPRANRPSRPPAPPKVRKPKGPAAPGPMAPTTGKQWKAMYTGTLKRLSRYLARHARDLLPMSDDDLLAKAEALPKAHDGRRGAAIRLARKLVRLRSQRPSKAA